MLTLHIIAMNEVTKQPFWWCKSS